MLTDKQKFELMRMYMRPVLVFSGIGSVSALGVMLVVGMESLVTTAGIVSFIKLLVLAFSILLYMILRDESGKFFYINLGLSEKKLMGWTVSFDLAVYFSVMILILILRYAIN